MSCSSGFTNVSESSQNGRSSQTAEPAVEKENCKRDRSVLTQVYAIHERVNVVEYSKVLILLQSPCRHCFCNVSASR